jgi:type IV pilus assembly protein PilO
MKAFGKELDVPADRLAKLSKNQRAAILGGTLLVLAAVFVSLLALPQHNKVKRLDQELTATAAELSKVKATVATLDAFKRDIWATEIEFKKALALLPNTKEIPGLLSSISQAGGQCGLEFVLFKPRAEVPKQFYADIPVEVKVRGNYHDIARFFDMVSKLPRIVNISELKIDEPKETGSGAYTVTAECLATTYKFIENVEAAPKNGKPGNDKGKKPNA